MVEMVRPSDDKADVDVKVILEHCKQYRGASASSSVFQLLTTIPLFFLNLVAVYLALDVSYFLSLLLAVPAAGLLTRLFIFQHDCGHGAFFNSRKHNDWTGRLISLFTFTPYDFWKRAHNLHHSTSGNLNKRSIGAIDTITVSEFRAMSPMKRLAYILYRNPLVLLILGTPFYVIFAQRLPFNQSFHFYDDYKTLPPKSIVKSIIGTNISLLLFYGVVGYVVGYGVLLMVYAPVLIMTAWIGGWLFYIQHQFEETYWEYNDDWNVHEAALLGSSYYQLPKVVQWFTGNIGLHHIHHLCSTIPNYKLQPCMDAMPKLSEINRMSFRESLKSLDLKLWDEVDKRLISYRDALA